MLLVIGEKEITNTYTNMLYHIGIVSYSKPSSEKIITGTRAVLIIAESVTAVTQHTTLPEFILSGETLYFMEKGLIHKKSESAASLADKISVELVSIEKAPLGKYAYGDITADANLGEVFIKSKSVQFTKTEKSILRSIIAASADGLTKDDILSLSFKSGREPLPSSVRVHVAKINKKLISYGTSARIYAVCGKYRLKDCR